MARAKARGRSRRRYFPRMRMHRKARTTIPIAVVAGFIPPVLGVWNRRSSATEMGNFIMEGFTGWSPGTNSWSFANLRLGMLPVVAGFLAHMVAGKLGINRVLARANIPLIRI